MNIAFHFSGPLQETPEFAALPPQELPEFYEADLFHLDAGISFDAPEKIRAPPRGQTMSPSGVPQEPEFVTHASIITTTSGTVHERR
jgi:hypothetical protein